MNWYDNNSNQVSFKITQKSKHLLRCLPIYFEFGISQENRQDQKKNLELNNGQKLENRIHPKLKCSIWLFILYTPSSSPLIPVFFEHFCFCSFPPLSLFFFSLLRVASGETFWKGSMPFFCFSAPPDHSSSTTTDCEYGVHMVLVLLLPSPLPSLFHGKGSRVWLILNCCSSAILCPVSDLTILPSLLSFFYVCMFIPIDSKLWLNIHYFDPMLWLNSWFFTNGQTQIAKAYTY